LAPALPSETKEAKKTRSAAPASGNEHNTIEAKTQSYLTSIPSSLDFSFSDGSREEEDLLLSIDDDLVAGFPIK